MSRSREAREQRQTALPIAAAGGEVAMDHRRVAAPGLAGAPEQVARLGDPIGPQPGGRFLELGVGIHAALVARPRPTSRPRP